MHAYRQIVTVKQFEGVLFVLKQILALRDLLNFKFLQACLVFQALLNGQIDFITHFCPGRAFITRPIAHIVQNELTAWLDIFIILFGVFVPA